MSGQATFDEVIEAERLKAEGMARAAGAVDADWRARADRAIVQLAIGGQPFTAEEVRQIAGDPDRPNAFGAVFNTAARRGLIRKVDYQLATRKSRHRNLVTVWEGTHHPSVHHRHDCEVEGCVPVGPHLRAV
jgi:hypothetical protein